ncbi:uncharacterized oxidoreductase At4g09670-like isoform X1 [Prosopis cineraria]|uniref:uncharacterized oxidoreductase At4g09670-like isoform X1 n=1 Tax=Prosopis cineraria TaxID=364024 RepID=UPI0024106217|nr:uncharacterized oxidoreductase At4g09670-like isoform X1 [Prosopis cineraria]
MAETTIRFGILGCADIARKLSRAITLSPNATLHAVASRSVDKATAFASANGFPPASKIYGSYEALLDDPDVDAVYVPLPTSLHVHWAVLVAQKKKHLLLEKPVALNAAEFDKIVDACESNGVQLMDGTMWMHHPRTAKMAEFLSDERRFGRLQKVRNFGTSPWIGLLSLCCLVVPELALLCYPDVCPVHVLFTYGADPDFLKNDIRVKPDLDALGSLGDIGWYCIRAILWAANFELPKTVIALRDPQLNEAGVILSCGASLYWEDGKSATFHCSFLSNLTMDITAIGTKGSLHVHDFVIPYQEKEASFFAGSESGFNDLVTAWSSEPSKHIVTTELPQEAQMVREFARLVGDIRFKSLKPEKKWPTISRKTQLVVDAVKASIEKGFEAVHIQEQASVAVLSGLDYLKKNLMGRST